MRTPIARVFALSTLLLGGSCDSPTTAARTSVGPTHPTSHVQAKPLNKTPATTPILQPTPHSLTPDEITEHIGQPRRVQWIKAAQLFVDGVESCVDGRDDHGVIGTPGGDAGELLLALAAVESLTGHQLKDEEVRRVFDDHLSAFGDFYLHSDGHAMEHLTHALAEDSRFSDHRATLATAAQMEAFVRQPPAELQEALLSHLLKPDGIGCGHLKLIAKHPDRYQVRPALLQAMLRVYYRDLWEGRDGLRFEVLRGEHAEGAIVQVHLDGPVHPYTKVPLIEPLHSGTEVFVVHPEVVRWLRRQRADFMHEEEATLGVYELDPEDVSKEVDRLGEIQIAATCESLADALPVYDVYVDSDQLVVR